MTACWDCAVEVGRRHEEGCDVARCSVCGGQRIACGCEGGHPTIHTGEWPGDVECREMGLWAVWSDPERSTGRCIPVPAGTPGAFEDLNRLASMAAQGELRWDGERWRLP